MLLPIRLPAHSFALKALLLRDPLSQELKLFQCELPTPRTMANESPADEY